ncbi:MAG: TRAP transporter substrate-binding protein DctP [Hyphomicrobiaceae bacterium]
MLTKRMGRYVLGAALVMTSCQAVQAQETTLRASSCFPQGSFFSKRFEAFIEKVNAAGKGLVKLNYLGGAPAIGSPFTLVQKLAQGVYDVSSCTGAYYQNVVPEADAWKLLERTPTEIRKNGGMELMSKIHRAKNLVPLAREYYGIQFHLFLSPNHKIDKPDLTGLHLRVAPIYTNFFKSLGATTQNSNLAQIFTLMENGTVNGYGWPVIGHRPGWDKVTKFRVDPGFYDVDILILANAAAWDKLTDETRAILTRAALEIEAVAMEQDAPMAAGAGAKQLNSGFVQIKFDGKDGEYWSGKARDAGWAGVNKVSPEHGPELRKLFAK